MRLCLRRREFIAALGVANRCLARPMTWGSIPRRRACPDPRSPLRWAFSVYKEDAMSLAQLNKHNRYDYQPLPERPDFLWPGNKRLAVCICNNIEVFSFLGGLGSDSAFLTARQTTRNYAWRDYGNRVGQWYVFDLLVSRPICRCSSPRGSNCSATKLDGPEHGVRIKQVGAHWS